MSDGTFVGIGTAQGEPANDRVAVMSSSDEGRTWRKISHIMLPPGHRGGVYATLRLPDDTLVWGISSGDAIFEDGKYVSGGSSVQA